MGEYKAEAISSCNRCGVAIRSFSGRISEADGKLYCVKCAEKIDHEYLVKNACAICGRVLRNDEVKFVLPSKSFGSESIPMDARLACAECYSAIASKGRHKLVSRFAKSVNLRRSMRKQAVSQMMERA